MPGNSVGSNRKLLIDLRKLEEDVLAEGQEWMRLRMEEKLRESRESFSPGGDEAASESPASKVDA